MEDIQILKPTYFPTVPRLLNKLYGKISASIKNTPGFKGWLLRTAVDTKMQNYKNGLGLTHSVYDKLIFNKIKGILGGNVKIMITGSAPIAAEVIDLMTICFCAPIQEGFGMTETSAGGTATHGHDQTSGHVGGPIASVKLRLRDVPEMNYYNTSEPAQGELCMFGPQITKGYFRNPKKTAEALINGWMHSGDIAQIDSFGKVTIIDRVKNIFKLSQGEYIAPEKLENIYVQSEWVLMSWIYGDSLKDYTIGFFVLDPEAMAKYCL